MKKQMEATSDATPVALVGMPKMKRARKPKALKPCVCGCGQTTKGTWTSGHDGRATGWAIRVERGMSIDAVPATERPGCELMLSRRAERATQAA